MDDYHCLMVSKRDDVTVVRFAQRMIVDDAAFADVVRELYALAAPGDCRKLLLSFENVEHFSSSMLGTLISLNARMRAKQGRLKLCEICPSLRELFQLTGLDQILDIRESEADGLKALLAGD